MTGKYKFKKANKYHRDNEIQKSKTMVLISCLTQLYSTFNTFFGLQTF